MGIFLFTMVGWTPSRSSTLSMPPSAAVISFSALDRDARVRRQIRALVPICNVTAMGFSDPCIDEVKFLNVGPPRGMARSKVSRVGEKLLRASLLKAGCFEAAYRLYGPVRRAAKFLKDHNFALIVANDLDTLPLALTHRRGAKVLYDAHEYTPKQYGGRFLWRFFLQEYIWYLCRTRITQPDAMTTVGPALAEEYSREFGVRPGVVLNTPPHHSIPVRSTERGNSSGCSPRGNKSISQIGDNDRCDGSSE